MLSRILMLTVFLCFSQLAAAKPAEYFFCVKSSKFETFKAHVVFRSVDFGETAARQMVYNDLKKHLGKDVQITPYNTQSCPCKQNCAVLEVMAKDWDGNMGETETNTSTIVGSAAEMLDKVIYESKEMFTDPGGFIKRKFFGAEEK